MKHKREKLRKEREAQGPGESLTVRGGGRREGEPVGGPQEELKEAEDLPDHVESEEIC